MTLPDLNVIDSNGKPRFRIVRVLGEGGMGVVYEAYDHTRGGPVALKKLRSLNAEHLCRFKREFRTARRVQHPNVVALYELVEDHGAWFFTMELVRGQHFVEALTRARPDADAEPGSDSDAAIVEPTATLASPDESVRSMMHHGMAVEPLLAHRPKLSERVDVGELRSALAQLAHALLVMHAEGVIHRDIKPSNILVTDSGQVMLTDFGVAVDVDEYWSKDAEIGLLAGTPTFMAPEQLLGAPPTEEVDWYAFGTLLYLMLAGRLPFQGSLREVIASKQDCIPVPPSALCDGIPTDLEELCMGLLEPRPEKRFGAHEILARLGHDDHLAKERHDRGEGRISASESGVFVGRHDELERLWKTYEEQYGAPRCVLVHGTSGMGKSRLVEQFLSELDRYALHEPVVLRARSHEREMFPYEAFDSIFEHMLGALQDMSEDERAAVLPADRAALAAEFPTLARIVHTTEDQGADAAPARADADHAQLRARGHDAFLVLVSNMTRRAPMVMSIDALHWADADSLDLLRHLMSRPLAGRLLVLATYCSESAGPAGNPWFEAFIEAVASAPAFVDLPLRPLTVEEQDDLLGRCIGVNPLPEDSRDIRRQAAGHPLLLTEMAHRARDTSSGSIKVLPVRLEDVIWERISRLSRLEARVLEFISVAREPVPAHVLADALQCRLGKIERALANLRRHRLTRTTRYTDDIWPDVYHPAVREAVARRLSVDEKRALEQALADALARWNTLLSPIVSGAERCDGLRLHVGHRVAHGRGGQGSARRRLRRRRTRPALVRPARPRPGECRTGCRRLHRG